MPAIGVVVNPKSRRNLRQPDAASRLQRRVGDVGIVREATSLDALRRIAREFRDAAIDVLAISGGDGTNSVTLTGFRDVYGTAPLPAIALLRGGTMNTLANSVGVPRRSPEELLARLAACCVRRAAAREPLAWTERDVMSVRALDEPDVSRAAFLFGTGVMPGFLAEYYAAGGASPVVAIRTLARAVASAAVGGELVRRMAQPFRGQVTVDGATWPDRDYLAVAAGTIAHVGLSFRPFYRFGERPGAFHALGVHASALELASELPRLRAGRPIRGDKAYDVVTTQMRLEAREAPLRYMLDGDLHTAERAVEVRIGGRVRLLTASSFA